MESYRNWSNRLLFELHRELESFRFPGRLKIFRLVFFFSVKKLHTDSSDSRCGRAHSNAEILNRSRKDLCGIDVDSSISCWQRELANLRESICNRRTRFCENQEKKGKTADNFHVKCWWSTTWRTPLIFESEEGTNQWIDTSEEFQNKLELREDQKWRN